VVGTALGPTVSAAGGAGEVSLGRLLASGDERSSFGFMDFRNSFSGSPVAMVLLYRTCEMGCRFTDDGSGPGYPTILWPNAGGGATMFNMDARDPAPPGATAPETASREVVWLAELAAASLASLDGELTLPGIDAPVEILRDAWGVPHIYAASTPDLFFAQGFVAAQDRLYQMEIWRRSGTGELSEVFGIEYVERDRVARLLRYRGDLEAEWRSYGKQTQCIVEAFTRGVNAYVKHCGDRLPLEFTLLDFRPGVWKPEHCLQRAPAVPIAFNAVQEVARAEMISTIGLEATMKYLPTDPPRVPILDPKLDLDGIDSSILAALAPDPRVPHAPNADGSNTWAVDGTLSSTGKPLLASDPHRPLLLPSLRYVSHLVAPGWDVVGAGEPSLPGIALGHNDRIAFGFTVVQFDQTDLYVETTASHDQRKYLRGHAWTDFTIETERISVRGRAEPVEVTLKLTHHGPIIWEDPGSSRAIALRWAGADPGAAPYLGCLEVDQARDWEGFRTALQAWRMPSESMSYADVGNNIGWITTGFLPIRKTWDGLLPVSGRSGEHEWAGFRTIDELPQAYNPPNHFIATANNNIIPQDYPYDVAFDWHAPYRIQRINAALGNAVLFNVDDFKTLQQDEVSIPARQLIALLWDVRGDAQVNAEAWELLTKWDCALLAGSAAAALFKIWLTRVRAKFVQLHVEESHRAVVAKYLQLPTLIRLIGLLPTASTRELLLGALEDAVGDAAARLGSDVKQWRWGSLHSVSFHHPLSRDEASRRVLDIGQFECGGDDDTVNSTRGIEYGCDFGPSYRQIIDLADWDRSLFVNIPGQSGQPGSPHYGDLLSLWLKTEYAPLLYSRAAIERNLRHRLVLMPDTENPAADTMCAPGGCAKE